MRDGLLETIAWFRGVGPKALRSSARRHALRPAQCRSSLRHKVAVIGTGYVGAVTSTCLAFLGHDVCGLDSDSVRAGQLNNGQAPFLEPGLPEMLKATMSTGRLRFTDCPAEALSEAEFVFLCVGTPPGPDGSPDLAQLESAHPVLGPVPARRCGDRQQVDSAGRLGQLDAHDSARMP